MWDIRNQRDCRGTSTPYAWNMHFLRVQFRVKIRYIIKKKQVHAQNKSELTEIQEFRKNEKNEKIFS